MKIKILILVTLTVLLLITYLKRPSVSKDNTITTDKVKGLIDEKADIFLLDVRTQKEYDNAHIKGVTLIPIQELKQRLGEVPADKDVIVICAAGGRSATATKMLFKKGFTRVFDMLGGTKEWQEKGYPVVK